MELGHMYDIFTVIAMDVGGKCSLQPPATAKRLTEIIIIQIPFANNSITHGAPYRCHG